MHFLFMLFVIFCAIITTLKLSTDFLASSRHFQGRNTVVGNLCVFTLSQPPSCLQLNGVVNRWQTNLRSNFGILRTLPDDAVQAIT